MTTADPTLLPPPETRSGAASPQNRGLLLAALGVAISVVGLFVAEGGVQRFAFDWLWGFAFLWCLVLGSLFFVALHHVTGAVWSTVLRRVAEMFAAPVGLVALLFAPILLLAIFGQIGGLYPWADPVVVEGDHLLEGKTPYLNLPFFFIRAAAFLLIWLLYSRLFVGRSLGQDRGELGAEATRSMRRASTHFMVVMAFTVSFAAIDWLMSLDPHWFSTIFGVYVWSGMVVTALSCITLATFWLRSRGRLGDGLVRDDHLYNLGALLFAFVCFWGYIAFSQYMLIWYANIPEETVWFAERMSHGWAGVSVVLPVVRFGIPFLLLLSRRAKSSPRVLVPVCILMIVGQWLDLYWLIMPQYSHHDPVLGWPELGPVLLVSGLVIFWAARFSRKHAMVAVGDPSFGKSCEFQM